MSSLCQSLVQIGHDISLDLRHAWASDLSFGEETITETNLLTLKRLHPRHVVLKSFTKNQEARNGADWEWWFIDSNKRIGFPMRVQAKRLPKNSHKFKNLLTYSAKKSTQRQIDMLINDAQKFGMMPLYCLYISEAEMYLANELYRLQLKRSYPLFEYGCWVGSATAIKAGRKQDLNGLFDTIFPWHFLVCRNRVKTSEVPSLPLRVRDALQRLPDVNGEARGSDEAIPQIVERLPSHVLSLLDNNSVERASFQLLERRLRGIVLFIDTQEAV